MSACLVLSNTGLFVLLALYMLQHLRFPLFTNTFRPVSYGWSFFGTSLLDIHTILLPVSTLMMTNRAIKTLVYNREIIFNNFAWPTNPNILVIAYSDYESDGIMWTEISVCRLQVSHIAHDAEFFHWIQTDKNDRFRNTAIQGNNCWGISAV